VRTQVLKAVRTASERAAKTGNVQRAAALLEGKYFPLNIFRLPDCAYETDTFLLIVSGAAREYASDRKLGADHPAAKNAIAAANEAWEAAGIAVGDEDAKDAALAEVAGTPVPRGQGGGIVLRLTKEFLQELEVRRK
jgi:hypothetical protein